MFDIKLNFYIDIESVLNLLNRNLLFKRNLYNIVYRIKFIIIKS